MSGRNYIKRFGRSIADRDGWSCYYCGVSLVPVDTPTNDPRYYDGSRHHKNGVPYPRAGYASASIDHVIPVSKGGTNDLDNLVLACHRCNARKRATDAADFMEALE